MYPTRCLPCERTRKTRRPNRCAPFRSSQALAPRVRASRVMSFRPLKVESSASACFLTSGPSGMNREISGSKAKRQRVLPRIRRLHTVSGDKTAKVVTGHSLLFELSGLPGSVSSAEYVNSLQRQRGWFLVNSEMEAKVYNAPLHPR